jgi:squalene synthase HpnC
VNDDRDQGQSSTSQPAPTLVEVPSGKGVAGENFPVGSFLLPAKLRPHVATFYAYARAIDDIADSPELAVGDKLARLEGFEQAVLGNLDDPAYAKGVAMQQSLAATGVTPRHCQDLISAFKQDAVKRRYDHWDDLMDYCRRSAAPVGRYLLDLHGETSKAYPYSDALCNALQVINHLQDCKDDFLTLDRVYLPGDWMRAEDVPVGALAGASASAGLLRVIRASARASGDLLAQARLLPGELTSRRLAMESAVILRLAEKLTARLMREDPLAGRVELSRPQFVRCGIGGLLDVLLGR